MRWTNEEGSKAIDISKREGLARVTGFAAAVMSGAVYRPLLLGAGAGAVLDARADTSCVLTSYDITGPYYTALNLVRSDLREDKPGITLDVVLRVQKADCTPVQGAAIAIWSCDAQGFYSEYPDVPNNTPIYTPVPLGEVPYEAPHIPEQDPSQHFMRGVQVTNANGEVAFRTIYPSWYSTRTFHLHVKVYPGGSVGDTAAFTTQLFFPEDANNAVLNHPAYTGRPPRDQTNSTDRHYVALDGVHRIVDLMPVPYGLLATKTLTTPL